LKSFPTFWPKILTDNQIAYTNEGKRIMKFARAMEIAREAHKGQVDQGGNPYIDHICYVFHEVRSGFKPCLIRIAVLHDVVEDSEWTLDMLRQEGLDEESIYTLDCLTRRKNEDYKYYIERILSDESACYVKLIDLKDNMNLTRIKRPLVKNDFKRIQKYHNYYWVIKNHIDSQEKRKN